MMEILSICGHEICGREKTPYRPGLAVGNVWGGDEILTVRQFWPTAVVAIAVVVTSVHVHNT